MQINPMVRASLRTVALLSMSMLGFSPMAKPHEQASPPASAQASSSTAHKANAKHANDFLVHGTVFTPEGLSFGAVELRIRKSTETKFRWKTETNSRGEFAVRVKQGTHYVVAVHMKGFKEQSKDVDATAGKLSDDLVFRMEPEGGKKQ